MNRERGVQGICLRRSGRYFEKVNVEASHLSFQKVYSECYRRDIASIRSMHHSRARARLDVNPEISILGMILTNVSMLLAPRGQTDATNHVKLEIQVHLVGLMVSSPLHLPRS
jgi:hypothetical protein